MTGAARLRRFARAYSPLIGVGCAWFVLGGPCLISNAEAARPTWLAPVALSAAAENATQPDVVIDSRGTASAVWLYQEDGTNDVVQFSSHSPNTSWATPIDLSAPGQSAESPSIASDANGDLAAVWLEYDGANYVVQVATKSAGGSWSAPVSLSPAGEDADSPHVTVDPAGDVFAAWDRSDGTDDRVQATLETNGTWNTVQTLSPSGVNGNLWDLKVNSSGTAMAGWDYYNSTGDYVVQVATYSTGSSSAGETLSSLTGDGYGPSIALDATGNATVAWQQRQPDGRFATESSSMPAGGSWSTPQVISGEETSGDFSALDSLGNVFLGWNLLTSSTSGTYQAQATTNGGTPFTLDSTPSPDLTALKGLASDSTGDVAALVFKDTYPPASLDVTYESDGSGTWTAPVPIASYSTNFSFSALALAPDNNGVAVWQQQGSGSTQIEAAFSTNTEIVSAPSASSNQGTATFAFSSIDPAAAGFKCSLDGAAMTACTSPQSYSNLANGQHNFEVEATDNAGLTDPAGPVSDTWTISVPAAGGGSAGTSGGTSGTTANGSGSSTAPASYTTAIDRLSALRLRPTAFVAAKAGPSLSRKAARRTGATISYTNTQPATVTLTVQRPTAGRRTRGACVAATKRNTRKPRCTRIVTVGAFTHTERVGRTTIHFSGRVNGRPLLAGSYRLRVIAANRAGSSRPLDADFRVLPRP
jgi:hypothetical protein